MTPVQSIRRYCKDCCGESLKEVRNCPDSQCPLYPFRLGKNPNAKGKMGKRIDRSQADSYAIDEMRNRMVITKRRI